MARRFVLLLALLLPLQFAWAGAAAYCQHESRAESTAHFGHHTHVHHGSAAENAGPAGQGSHSDCATCHVLGASLIDGTVSGAEVFPAGALQAVAGLAIPGSAPPRAPDRPQWVRLV